MQTGDHQIGPPDRPAQRLLRYVAHRATAGGAQQRQSSLAKMPRKRIGNWTARVTLASRGILKVGNLPEAR